MSKQSDQLEQLVEAVLHSSRYRDVSREFIQELGARELGKRSNLKEAIKTTKAKLHQVGGAYQAEKKDYARWLREIEQLVHSGSQDNLQAYLKTIMPYHASTRERIPILGQFYQQILASLPPVSSILDIACGLHPLALPWMPLAKSVRYYACDIYADMTNFLQAFLELLQIQGQAQTCDVIQSCPAYEVDLAFVLKAIPCLEQIDKTAGSRLLHNLKARHILVSFPVHSLSGRKKGMEANYEAHFFELIEGTSWSIQRFEFSSELAFLITR